MFKLKIALYKTEIGGKSMEIKSPQSEEKEHPLPQLRKDIKFYRGPDEADGSPTYNLYDPVKAQYFKVSWAEATILQQLRPNMTVSQLAEAVNQNATFQVTPEEVKNFFIDISRNNLLASRRASEDVLKEAELRKTNPFVWFVYYYLYFRIPLLNPNEFLARTLKYVEPLASSFAFLIYFSIALMGLFMLVGRFEEFLHTFTYFFNFQGIIVYSIAIICVKIIHEFSHAYVAKHYGLYVPTMGLAFIVLWPVLYTDVTDGWKLSKRSERLAISFAGIAAELILAGIATFGWAVSDPGQLQSVFFIVSSATWVSTLAINLNPAMRFDGYYLMCDLSGIDNLQMRSFAFTRWQLRKWLLGLDVPCPEELVTPYRRFGMMTYTIYTWVYRLFLYTAIAVFVYYKFTKAMGIFLFLIEIGIFLIAPFVSEARQLKTLYPFLKINPNLIATGSILALVLTWFVIPLPHQERFAAVTVPVEEQTVYIPQDGVIQAIHVKLGDTIEAGQALLNIDSIPMNLAIEDKKADAEIVKSQINILSLSESDKGFLPEKKAELASIHAKLNGLENLRELFNIKATKSGLVYAWDDKLSIGQSVSKDQVIGKIAPADKINVLFFVPEANIKDIHLGEEVLFRSKGLSEEAKGKIKRILDIRATVLNYPQLASINQGELPVNEETPTKLSLVESYFPVEVSLDKNDPHFKLGETGNVIMEGPWKSKAVSLWTRARSIFWRESGF